MPIISKGKLSKSTYLLIFLVIGAIIVVGVLAAIGYIDLTWVSDGILGIAMYASTNIVVAIGIPVGSFILGALFYYALKRYFIGDKVNAPVTPYTPQGQTLSQPQQSKDSTVIS
jgi:hypothetical protein